jgi:alpha-N-arabinofuranosidase
MKKQFHVPAINQRVSNDSEGLVHSPSRRRFLRSSVLAAAGGAASLAFAERMVRGVAGAQPQIGKIVIDVTDSIGEINRNIYGHMLESVGRALYDGVWVGEGSAVPNDRGFRKDAIAAFQQLRAPVVRWPGGCFADT